MEKSILKQAVECMVCVLIFCGISFGDESIDARIRQNRMGELIVKTKPGAKVHVEQQSHEFWFGAAIANQAFDGRMSPDDAAKYKKVFLENFNAAVPENALKWGVMEWEKGKVDYLIVDAILAWTEKNEIPIRGHNIYWGMSHWVQPWIKSLDDTTLRETLKARGLDIGRRYRGRFAEYDLNNEMLHDNYYEQRLGPGITRDMADWVREGDPCAVLFFNDYDILTGKMLDPYIGQIRKFLDQNVPFGGIGVQGHSHGDSFNPKTLQASLDKLAALNLPVRVTEFCFPGQHTKYIKTPDAQLSDEEEQAKAKAITEYYQICFAHPAVQGIMMWGFWEPATWIPQSSLYRRDWTPTPAAEAYRDLVFKQWWTRWDGKADANGQCQVRAFYGKYNVTCEGQTKQVHLKKQAGPATVSFE
jgi:endo-1,4-beta-xylanase